MSKKVEPLADQKNDAVPDVDMDKVSGGRDTRLPGRSGSGEPTRTPSMNRVLSRNPGSTLTVAASGYIAHRTGPHYVGAWPVRSVLVPAAWDDAVGVTHGEDLRLATINVRAFPGRLGSWSCI
jgi:hypothetical protein